MKKFDLKADDNTITKILKDAELSRVTEIKNILKIISSIEDNSILAIDGDWGCGKTFFLEEIKYLIKNEEKRNNFFESNNIENEFLNHKKLNNTIVLYYNAWENDLYEDPLESLLLFLLNELEHHKEVINDFDKVKEVAKKIIQDLKIKGINTLNNKVKEITGIDVLGIQNYLKNIMQEIENINSYEELAKNIITTNEIKEAINNLLEVLLKEKTRVLFIIDELDRCKPDYAVRLLETIKHFYNNSSVAFLVGVNIKELENTIKKFYGENFDGYKYLHKFFDIIMNIKKFNTQKYIQFLIQEKLLEEPENLQFLIDFIESYNFSLRDINRYLFMYELVKPLIENYSTGKENYAINKVLVPLMLALKVADIKETRDFLNGKPNFEYILRKVNYKVVKKHEEVLGASLDAIITEYYANFFKSDLYYEILNLI